jgi:hypothetical protein
VDAMATNAANANNKTPYYVIQLKVCLWNFQTLLVESWVHYLFTTRLPDGMYICIPKITICVYFWEPWNGEYIYCAAISNILGQIWSFSIFFPVLVCCT